MEVFSNVVALKFFAILSTISALFYLIGFCAVSGDGDTVAKLAWYVYSDGDFSDYFGLSVIAERFEGVIHTYAYKGSFCTTEQCKTCEINGDIAALIMICCTVLCFVAVYGNINRSYNPSTFVRNYNILLHGCIIIFAIISFACFKQCPDSVIPNDYTVGTGLVLPIIAVFFNVFNCVSHVLMKDYSLLDPGYNSSSA